MSPRKKIRWKKERKCVEEKEKVVEKGKGVGEESDEMKVRQIAEVALHQRSDQWWW